MSCDAAGYRRSVAQTRYSRNGSFAGARAFITAARRPEAAACKDEDVYIIGGANSAGQAAMSFSNMPGAW